MSSNLNFDQTNRLPAMRITEIRFSYPAGANEIRIDMRISEVLRDGAGVEHEIDGKAQMVSGVIQTASLNDLVMLHDVRTGEVTGQTIQKGAIVAAVNSLCRQIVEAQVSTAA